MNAIEVRNLNFAYGEQVVFEKLELAVLRHSRCLCLGANGVGKTTLLRLLAGKHLIAPGSIKIFGHDPFSGELGPHDFSLVGEKFPFDLDVAVSELLASPRASKRNPKRERELLELLRIDPGWRMHRVSNGQRRRVDLMLSLLSEPKLLLLDEVTAELDILGRQDLLSWLKAQTSAGRLTVFFATHILDGMHEWATHLAFLSPAKNGARLRCMVPFEAIPGWADAVKARPQSPLLWICEKWLREDADGQKKR